MAGMRIPVGEVTEFEKIPTGTATELPKKAVRAPARTIPSLPATAPADPFQKLPVGEATEFKTLPVGQATEIERTGGVRNPNIVSGNAGPGRMSPEARAWMDTRNSPTSAARVTPAGYSAGQKLSAGLRRIGDFASTPGASLAMRGLGAASSMVDANDAINSYNRGDVAGAIDKGVSSAMTAVTASPMVGALPALGVGLAYRGGHLAGEKIYENMTPDTQDMIGGAINRGLRFFGGGVDDSAMKAQAAPTNGLPGNRSLPSTGAGGGRGFVNPAVVNPAAPLAAPGATLPVQGDIVKTVDAQGRTTYTGQGDVGAGARIVDPMGRVSQSGGGVTSIPAAGFTGGPTGLREALAGTPLSYSGAAAAEAQAPAPLASFQSSTRGNMRSSPTGETVDPMDEIKSRGLNARGANLLLQARNQAMGNETQRRGQDLSAATAAAGNETQRRGQDLGASTTMRGQDITAETAIRGQDMSNQLARTQAALQRESNMRQYQLEVEKFGHEKAKTLHAQREAGQKDFQTWAENQFIGEDGKPDMAKAADFSMAATASLGGLIARLEQAGQKDKADKLRAEGFAGLDMEDRALLRTLYERRAAVAADTGTGLGKLNPFSASGPISNDLFASMITGIDKGLVQERYKMAGGQSVGRNTLDYAGGANAVTAPFKTQSTALQPTLRERQLLDAQLAKQNLRSN